MSLPAAAALAAVVVLPAGVGAVLLLAGRRADRAAGPVAAVTAVLTAAVAVAVAVTRPSVSAPFLDVVRGGELGFAVDPLSAVLVVTVTLTATAVVAFAVVDLPAHAARARFFGYLMLFVAAMLATVTATTVPALLVSWEVMGATSYALIGYRWQVPGKLAAGATAFLTTRLGDLGLYVAAGAALAGTGTLVLADLPRATGGWLDVAAAGVLIAALGKSAQLPFSAWLSAAMQGPSPVSALLHSATMVAAGGYLLLRMQPLLTAAGWAGSAAAWAGALTALVLGAVACAQADLKQLLAASTAAQIGFVVLAAGVGSRVGGVGQLVAHAAVKASLFVAAGAWLIALGTKQLADLRGAARRYPVLGVAATAAALALAGVPPLSLWATKDEILAGVDATALRAVTLAAAALSAVYAGRILATVWARPTGTERIDEEEPGTRRVPPAAVVVTAVLAAVGVVLGVLAVPDVAHAVARLLGAVPRSLPGPVDLLLSAAIAVVALAVVVARPATVDAFRRTRLHGWAGLPRLLSGRPAMAVARAAAAVDDRVIDGAARGVAVGAVRIARRLSRADSGVIDGAVRGIAGALRRAGTAARRPQTGLVHQYYAQTVVGLAALLVLLLLVR